MSIQSLEVNSKHSRLLEKIDKKNGEYRKDSNF